ncbi:hypothetical protein XENOCAPTIV_022538 [Xenoophorus captivus]|uniref:Uncharacterized protein n=1 Tax=Xenoophorus captivus TaxID=1517983 RepID=A0ABV0QKE4_9TELE
MFLCPPVLPHNPRHRFQEFEPIVSLLSNMAAMARCGPAFLCSSTILLWSKTESLYGFAIRRTCQCEWLTQDERKVRFELFVSDVGREGVSKARDRSVRIQQHIISSQITDIKTKQKFYMTELLTHPQIQ